jgi:hypothetical protein
MPNANAPARHHHWIESGVHFVNDFGIEQAPISAQTQCTCVSSVDAGSPSGKLP